MANMANSGQSEANGKRTQLEEAQAALTAAESTVKSLQRQLAVTTKEKLELESQLSALSDIEQELANTKAQVKQANAENAERLKALTEARRMIAGLEQKFAECQKDRQAAQE